jgi:hypothetical protein
VNQVGETYHLFTTEMVSDPMWVKTRFGHWTSRDRLSWTRVATVRESSGEFEGQDPRAALWSPLPVWDPGEGRWNLFYVAYRAKPTDGTRFIESPIVTEAPGGGFLAVYDSETADGVGWAYSGDGVRWGKGQGLVLQPKAGEWAKEVRTPLGLVPEGGDRFTLFYTGFEQPPNWQRILDEASSGETCAVGFVELRLDR